MVHNAQKFIAEFGDHEFRHSEVLLRGICEGEISVDSASEGSSQQAGAYLDIYEFRLEGLVDRRGTTEHIESLRADVTVLCEGLREDRNEPCDLWIFEEPPYYMYSVWIGRRSRKILGCVKGIDDRLISDAQRRQIWGEAEVE